MKNRDHSFVDLSQPQLSWFRKPGIMGNVHHSGSGTKRVFSIHIINHVWLQGALLFSQCYIVLLSD